MRKARHLLLPVIALFCLPGPVAAQQTLELANGDRLTGQLQQIEPAGWIFRYGGADVRVPAAQIAAYSSGTPIGIRLTDGTLVAATVSAAPGGLELRSVDGSVRIVKPAALAAIGSADDLDALREVRIGLFQPFHRFWGASGGLGYTDKSGNSRARGLAIALDVERKTAKDRISLGAGLNTESSRPPGGEFETTVEKYFGFLRGDVFVSRALFVFAETRQERDRFQDIRLRSTYNAGLGVQVVATDRTDIRLSASGGLRIERFFENDGSETDAVAVIGTGFRQELGPAAFQWRTNWTPNLDDFSDYRFRSDATLTTRVYAGFGIRVGLLNEYNNAPRPGVRNHDVLVTTAVTYSIGR